MGDTNKSFKVSTRIPTRPLDYSRKEEAEAKELLVDYKTGNVYVCTEDKQFVDITTAVKNLLAEDPTVIKDTKITLESGDEVTIEAGLVKVIADIEKLQSPLIIDTTILAGEGNWTATTSGSSTIYLQRIDLTNIKETDYPVVDIHLSSDYSVAVEEIESYSMIFKILTFDGYIEVYATGITRVDLNIFMKTDRIGG